MTIDKQKCSAVCYNYFDFMTSLTVQCVELTYLCICKYAAINNSYSFSQLTTGCPVVAAAT